VPDYANVLVTVVAIFGVLTVYMQLHLHTFFVTPQLRIPNSLGKFGFQALIGLQK